MPPIQRERHAHSRSLHHPRIIQHRLKSRRRRHHIFIPAKKSRVRHAQNFSRSKPKNHALRRNFIQRSNLLLQIRIGRIGITHSRRFRARHGRKHPSPRPIRIFVKIQTNQSRSLWRRRSALALQTPSECRRHPSSRNSRSKPQRKFPARKRKSSHRISSRKSSPELCAAAGSRLKSTAKSGCATKRQKIANQSRTQGAKRGQKQKEKYQIPQSHRKESPVKSNPLEIDRLGNTKPGFNQRIAPATGKISRNQRSPRLLARRLRRNAPRTARRKSARLAAHRLANARASAHSSMGHRRLQPGSETRLAGFPLRLLAIITHATG